MNAKFIISHLDQQMGPFTELELKAKWAKGELLPIDYVFDEVRNDWILLSERFLWTKAAPASTGPAVPAAAAAAAVPTPSAATAIPAASVTPAVTPAATPAATSTKPSSETAPPPLRADVIKKKQPPPPPAEEATRPDIVVPHLNIPKFEPELEIVAPKPVEQVPTVAAVAQVTHITPVAEKIEGTQTKVQLVNGMGEVDIANMTPGAVELVVNDSALKLQQPLRVQVKALEPAEITWSFPLQHTVGNELEIVIKALDNQGNLCSHYFDDFSIKIAGSDHKDVVARVVNGQASVKMNHTRAEVWKVSLQYSGTRTLRLPEAKVLEWQPGAAARLILDGPPELIAGNPLKVQVRAVDQYGNLAKTFQGTVVLEVKAS